MARMIGSGGAENAAKAIAKRRYETDKELEAAEGGKGAAQAAPVGGQKMKDASAGAYKDRQMQEAIEMVRKKKSARRTDYQN